MNENQSIKQVKSKERVQKHGEVFTPAWVVNDMLDLLPAEVWEASKTFLEPACGEGAFLVEIYRRKLQHIHASTQDQWEWQAAIATSSIYGIELLADNAKQCRLNLTQIFNDFYHNNFPNTQDENIVETIRFLINRNIIQGNALTCRKCTLACGNECSKCDEIVFSEWIPLTNERFKRNDYTYEGIINADKNRQKYVATLFEVEFSKEEHGLIKEYKPVKFKRIQYAEN
ncbi:MAG: SAM-dependent methyltransferase [Bacteroidales bacterium]|nr:SAM-dependent methyltransferase [Bacteroidales bacterium]